MTESLNSSVRISVIIPAYNSGAFIHATIDSVLAQTIKPFEIIVVDDGSKDNTAEIAERYGEPVRVLRKKNGGPASARNEGAMLATGDWLALLDADDQWLPTKLERQLQFTQDDSVGVVHTLVHGRKAGSANTTFHQLWRQNIIVNSTVLLRRAAFLQMEGFDEARELISVEDYNFWLRLAHSGWKIRLCPEVLTSYTVGVGISSNSEKFLKASICNIDSIGKRLALDPTLVAEKKAEIYAEFGSGAIFRRDLKSARRLFSASMACRPTTGTALKLAVSFCPPILLDTRRRLLNRRPNGQPGPGGLAVDHDGLEKRISEIFFQETSEKQKDVCRSLAQLALMRGPDSHLLGIIGDLAWLGYRNPTHLDRILDKNQSISASSRLDLRNLLGSGEHIVLLEIVLCIRRRASAGLPPVLKLDALIPFLKDTPLRTFMPLPVEKRDRAAAALLLCFSILRKTDLDLSEVPLRALDKAVALSRRLFEGNFGALAGLRQALGDGDADYFLHLAAEVDREDRLLWLEALLLAETLRRRLSLQNDIVTCDVPQNLPEIQ